MSVGGTFTGEGGMGGVGEGGPPGREIGGLLSDIGVHHRDVADFAAAYNSLRRGRIAWSL